MTSRVTEQHKKEFEENGFFVLEGVLSESEVTEVRKKVMKIAQFEIDNNIAHFYDEKGAAQRVWNLLNKDAIFRELIQRQVILETMDWIFDRDTPHQKYYLSSFQAHILHPGAERMKLHIDTPVPEPLPDWVIKANTIWVLDEFTDLNGATEYLPGSHKLKYKPSLADQSRNDLTVSSAPLGSVLVIHGALWHRAGKNSSKSKRTCLLGSFAASYAREIANEENYSIVLDPAIIDDSTDELRAILGLGHGIRQGSVGSTTKPD